VVYKIAPNTTRSTRGHINAKAARDPSAPKIAWTPTSFFDLKKRKIKGK